MIKTAVFMFMAVVIRLAGLVGSTIVSIHVPETVTKVGSGRGYISRWATVEYCQLVELFILNSRPVMSSCNKPKLSHALTSSEHILLQRPLSNILPCCQPSQSLSETRLHDLLNPE